MPSPSDSKGSQLRQHLQRLGWVAVALVGMNGGVALASEQPWVIAQSSPPLIPPEKLIFQTLLTLPSAYDPGNRFGNGNGLPSRNTTDWPTVVANTPSYTHLTPPSLWWNRDQLISRWGGYRLIDDWVAFHHDLPPENPNLSGLRVIDVQVDRQYWDRLNDTSRFYDARQYSLLNQWGSTASSYGYHLRLYRAGRIVGIYACNFSARPEFEVPPVTEISLDQLTDLPCFAEVGPFVVVEPPAETLFAPP